MKKIFLTVDTECHNIDRINQYIYGVKKSKKYGLVNILEVGKKYNIPINFMVDVCEEKRYGAEYLKKIVDTIHSYGQPVYFHLHPNYISNDDSKSYLWQYDSNEMKSIFAEALEIYKKYGDYGDYIIFRAGRYGTNKEFYDMLNENNFKLLDLSYFYSNNKMCKLKYSEIGVKNTPAKYGNIDILPNTTYIGFDYFSKKSSFILNVADTTFNEFKILLKNNHLNNLVYTMHSWDLINKWFFMPNYISENRRNKRKLEKAIIYAKKNGYVFSDLKDYTHSNDVDEVQNLCSGFFGKIRGLFNNYIRFKGIAHLNKKYLIFYLLVYTFIAIIIATIILLVIFL